jgi:hypothetical protein
VLRSIFFSYLQVIFTYRKILLEAFGFISSQKEDVLRISIVLKNTSPQPGLWPQTFTFIQVYFPSAGIRRVSRVAQSVYCPTTGWKTWRSRFDPRQRRKNFFSNLCPDQL